VNNNELRALLERTQTIAVVGMSAREGQAAHEVPKRLMQAGFTVVPVNPHRNEILGLTCYPSLEEVPVHVDMVDVFRRSEHTPPIVRSAVAIEADAVWLQLGIESEESRTIAEEAGLDYVEDLCLAVVVSGLGVTKG
jgi:predicted CoA-binding protein